MPALCCPSSATWRPGPPLDLTLSKKTQSRLPVIAGGLTYGLARVYKIINPRLRNPQTAGWEQALGVLRAAAVTR